MRLFWQKQGLGMQNNSFWQPNASIKSENRKNIAIELRIKLLGGKLRSDKKSCYAMKRHFAATVQLPIRNLFCDGGKEGKDEEIAIW